MPSQYESILQLGKRLKAYRIGKGLTPDEMAKNIGISRAAIYRYESGQPTRVDVLGKIADHLGVSLTSLLGVGSEYITSALTFFDRMLQIEAASDQITVLFGPVSYLLTTDGFDEVLPAVLRESVPKTATRREGVEDQIDQIMAVLRARKATYQERRPNIVSLVSSAELEQWLASGFVGQRGLPEDVQAERRIIARREVEHVLNLIEDQPMGVQIGVVEDSLPSSSFQIFRNGGEAQVAVSPFRLGAFANIRIGVATVTSAQESVQLHQDVVRSLWRNSLKGDEAAVRLRKALRDTVGA